MIISKISVGTVALGQLKVAACQVMTSVAEILDRAERFFEVRVSQLLDEKRIKAEENGTVLNARKAKRDARTAAGREKLDALVRKLADLALIQEKLLRENCPDIRRVQDEIKARIDPNWVSTHGSLSHHAPPIPPHFLLPPHIPYPFHIFPQGHPPPHMLSLPLHPPPPPPYLHPPRLRTVDSPNVPVATQASPVTSPKHVNTPFGPMSRTLNPDADPWEVKPPTPRKPPLPPPLKMLSSIDMSIYNDEEEENEDTSTPMFDSTENVLRQLGPDFQEIYRAGESEHVMDEISPTSIFNIAYPRLDATKE